MFDKIMSALSHQKNSQMTKDEIAKLLKTSPEALAEFEKAYSKAVLNSEPDEGNLFAKSAKQIADENHVVGEDEFSQMEFDEQELEKIVDTIVEELVAITPVWKYDGEVKILNNLLEAPAESQVPAERVNTLPKPVRPMLTRDGMTLDLPNACSSAALLENYRDMLNAKSPERKKMFYHLFRQGLDTLDLDPIIYEMLGQNKNSMGYWLPKLVVGICSQNFFKVPKTTIIKVPMSVLQLTRLEYRELNPVTLAIVDRFCQKVFELDESKEYFIKTGTYSSKYDFRNAHVKGAKEVRELGEYLTYIQYQAQMMASPLCQPCFYGVSTTNEWVVRDFIQDKENNPCIYEGMPLHTEYRVFVDMDTNKILGVNPYWDPKVMKDRFDNSSDSGEPRQMHDSIVYRAHEEILMNRYHENVDKVVNNLEAMLSKIDLHGQWSVDVMQNGDEFWIIDMALAESSAFYKECVPVELRNPSEENWIPRLN